MIYVYVIWLFLAISTVWMISASLHVKHASLIYHQSSLVDQIMLRSHAALLFVLAISWSLVFLFTSAVQVGEVMMHMDNVLSLIIIVGLTPAFSYIIHFTKYHIKRSSGMIYQKSGLSIGWTLNVLTALLYASLINYSIQMLLLV